MAKANVYRKKGWTGEDLRSQYMALDPDNRVSMHRTLNSATRRVATSLQKGQF